jgi:hypothetical protein
MGDKLAGRTGKVLACLCQGLEVRERVGTSGVTCKHPQPIWKHRHVSRAQGAVGQKRRNRIGNLSHGFWFYRLFDLDLLHSNGLWTRSGLTAGLLKCRIRLVSE